MKQTRFFSLRRFKVSFFASCLEGTRWNGTPAKSKWENGFVIPSLMWRWDGCMMPKYPTATLHLVWLIWNVGISMAWDSTRKGNHTPWKFGNLPQENTKSSKVQMDINLPGCLEECPNYDGSRELKRNGHAFHPAGTSDPAIFDIIAILPVTTFLKDTEKTFTVLLHSDVFGYVATSNKECE